MTRHLGPDDFIAALESAPSPDVAAHLAVCATCHDEFASLRASWNTLAAADVPEPSPLFWDHFSARVREATVAAPVVHESWWSLRRLVWGLAPAVLVLSAAMMWLTRGPTETTVAVPSVIERAGEPAVEFDDVADLFQAMPLDDAEVFAPAGTATWAMVDDLTVDERVAFVRLIEEELEALQ